MGKRGQAKPKGMRGPADRFTPETAAQIVASLSLGLSRKQACHVAGIDRKLFSAWRKQGLAAPGGSMGKFAKDVREAESRGIAQRLARLTQAAAADWRADAWWLEHVRPEQFARNRVQVVGKFEHTGAGGHPLGHPPTPAPPLAALTQEERDEYDRAQKQLRRLAEKAKAAAQDEVKQTTKDQPERK